MQTRDKVRITVGVGLGVLLVLVIPLAVRGPSIFLDHPVESTDAALEELVAQPWRIAIIAYFMLGTFAVLFISLRGRWWRLLTDEKASDRDKPYDWLAIFLRLGLIHPIAFFIEVLLWPLWLLILWALFVDSRKDLTNR